MAGPQLSLNTADLQLFLGGYYLLEDSSGRYLLEDGSGAYLIDAYVPQLGDPVTFTSPSWSGRVTNVERRDILTMRTNYDEVTVSATNAAVAVAGTGATLSDGGSYYSLEDSSGRYLLEDSSGFYLLDAYAYRELSVKTSQNQDGTTTTYGSLVTYQSGYSAGQTFLLVSNNLGIASNYTITNVRTTFEGVYPTFTPEYTLEFGDAYQTLQTAGGGVLTRTASQATQTLGVAMPGGVLGQAKVTADQGTFTADTAITGLSVTVQVPSGRRVEIKVAVMAASSVAGDQVRLLVRDASLAIVQTAYMSLVAANNRETFELDWEGSPTAGVQTYSVYMARTAGTGNITMKATTGEEAFIKVIDAGT